jgi:hypothetical protein
MYSITDLLRLHIRKVKHPLLIDVAAENRGECPEPYVINLMDKLKCKGISQFYASVEKWQKVHCMNTLFTGGQLFNFLQSSGIYSMISYMISASTVKK